MYQTGLKSVHLAFAEKYNFFFYYLAYFYYYSA